VEKLHGWQVSAQIRIFYSIKKISGIFNSRKKGGDRPAFLGLRMIIAS